VDDDPAAQKRTVRMTASSWCRRWTQETASPSRRSSSHWLRRGRRQHRRSQERRLDQKRIKKVEETFLHLQNQNHRSVMWSEPQAATSPNRSEIDRR